MQYNRKHTGLFASWWWTVDRPTLFAVGMLIIFSALMVPAASPAVAERIGLDSFYFVRRQFVFLSLTIAIIFLTSLLSAVMIRRLSIIGFLLGLVSLVLVLLLGFEAKGATRWIQLGSLSLQPSEFLKPLFIVTTAWILSQKYVREGYPGFKLAIIFYTAFVGLLLLQPDVGMSITISIVWGGQLFLAGLPLFWIPVIMVLGICAIIAAYISFPHVALRIDRFLYPDSSENYQVHKSLEAFTSGSLYGKGPGEGVVKQSLPDSHTDFIFAVIGEELGVIVCILLVVLFAFIVIRGMLRILQERDLFLMLASSGLLMLFGIQTLINMGVTLNLLPTKGMTLPFISYGGSSMLSMGLTVGILLSLSRKRYGQTLNSFNKVGIKSWKKHKI